MTMCTAGLGIAANVDPATYFFVTGHTSAQTQIDVDHSTVFYSTQLGDAGGLGGRVSVSELDPTFDWNLGGGKFLMKDGSSTSAGVSFSIYEFITLQSAGTVLATASFTDGCVQQFSGSLTSAEIDSCPTTDFARFKYDTYGDSNSQSFGADGNTVNFVFDNPVTLVAGRHYEAILSSTSVDQQNAAFFIKGLAGPLNIVDPNGNSLPPDAPTPEPGTLFTMIGGVTMFGLARFTKARA